jgi:hypothetical protein
MKRVAFLLLAVLVAEVAMGQTDSVLSVYRDQYIQLSKEYAKNPDNVANLMELATFYSQTDNPYTSLTLAAGYAERSEVLYTAWVQDKKRYRDVQKLIRKGITIPVIRQKRKDIEAQAVLYVRSHVPQMDEAEVSAFVEAFPNNAEIVKRLQAKSLSVAYEQVKNENTIEGYVAFILTHPNTAEAEAAEAELARLAPRYMSRFDSEAAVDFAVAAFPANAVIQQAAMRQKSRIAYMEACRVGSEEAFSHYLDRYPRGDYYMDALDRLHQLRRDDFRRLTTPEELAEYAKNHSDDPMADSALARLRNMVVQERNQHAKQVYLSQFPLDEQYSDVYRHCYEWYAEEGNGEPIRSFAAAHPDYPYKMAWSSDLARAKIIDSVDLTQPYQEADYDQMETNIRLLMGRKVAFVALQRILQHQIAHKEWAAARSRMQKFDLCFEDVSNAEYAELAVLLSDNGAKAARLEMALKDITHLVAHPTDGTVYFSYTVDSNSAIGYARRIGIGKHAKWQRVGDVRIEGCDTPAVPYSFYDEGRKALLGIEGDIWSAEIVSDSLWRILEHFESPINTPSIEQDAFILEDYSGMLLVSDRPGGMNVQHSGSYYHGDHAPAFDIYFIPFAGPHRWEAINLGVGINTPYCEHSPILSRNMRTLYYVTDAGGLGYGDIYRVTRTDLLDWTHWSKPVNMGRGVNGAFDEGSLSFAQGEGRIYYLSGTSPRSVNAFRSFATDHDTTDCRHQVAVDMSDNLDVLRNVRLVEPRQQGVILRLNEDQIDSLQSFPLYCGMSYALIAEADWVYIPTLIIEDGGSDKATLEGYTLEQLKEPVPLPLTEFRDNTAQLLPLAKLELKALAQFVQQHSKCQIELLVHAKGTDDDRAYDLSLKRATAIRNFLVGCGIGADRIHLSAYGNMAYKKGLSPIPVAVRFL